MVVVPADLPRSFALAGPGRAGGALALALRNAGLSCVGVAGPRRDHAATDALATRLGAEVRSASELPTGADLVLLTVPDARIAAVAAEVLEAIEPGAIVAHCSGLEPPAVLPLRALAARGASGAALHPLQSLPDWDRGARRLPGSAAAVAGDPRIESVATSIGLRPFRLADEQRVAYHAAATVASNHLVVLLAQVERLAATAGVPFGAFVPLVRATVENVVETDAAAALTGAVRRRDTETVARHLGALDRREQALYRPLARGALDLTPEPAPAMLELLDRSR